MWACSEAGVVLAAPLPERVSYRGEGDRVYGRGDWPV